MHQDNVQELMHLHACWETNLYHKDWDYIMRSIYMSCSISYNKIFFFRCRCKAQAKVAKCTFSIIYMYTSISSISKFVDFKFHLSITTTSFVIKWYKYFHEIKTRRACKSFSTLNVICNWKDFPIWNGKWVFLIFFLVYL